MNKKLTMDELNRLSVSEYKDQVKLPLILVLDNIRSMNNVGSVFRTADSFNIEKIILVGITACPPNREIAKTALGAENSVTWQYAENIENAIEILRHENCTICSIEQVSSSTMLNDFIPEKNKKYAYIFGNEVFGVSESAIESSDFCIEIPQFGTKHSLNIAVTVGITCWDFIQKTYFSK